MYIMIIINPNGDISMPEIVQSVTNQSENEMLVEITQSAISQVENTINREKWILRDTLLRLVVRGQTETDYKIGLGLDERKDNIHHLYDNFYNLGQFEMVIDDDTLLVVEGAKIDYQDNIFTINNPNKPMRNEI
jgi:Fe-S cluster assembly iron-binding protein IscA